MYSLGRWEGKATRLVIVYCQSLSVQVGGWFQQCSLPYRNRDNNEWEGRKERRKERKGGEGREAGGKEERKGKNS